MWYYNNNDPTAAHFQDTHFRPKSNFLPYINNSTLNSFLFDEKKQLIYKLLKAEKAITWLSSNDDVKRADKGGAVVVWGRDQYITKAMRLNCEYYQPLSFNPIEQI